MLSKSVADKFEEYNDQIADLDDKVADKRKQTFKIFENATNAHPLCVFGTI